MVCDKIAWNLDGINTHVKFYYIDTAFSIRNNIIIFSGQRINQSTLPVKNIINMC